MWHPVYTQHNNNSTIQGTTVSKYCVDFFGGPVLLLGPTPISCWQVESYIVLTESTRSCKRWQKIYAVRRLQRWCICFVLFFWILSFIVQFLARPYTLWPQFPAPSWQEWHPMCSSAAVSHWISFISRVVYSETMVLCIPRLLLWLIWVTVAFLWPLASTRFLHPETRLSSQSDAQKIFSLFWYFIGISVFSLKPRDSCAWQSQWIGSF